MWRPKVDGLFLLLLWDFNRENTELPFTEEEVNRALLNCWGDKAPIQMA